MKNVIAIPCIHCNGTSKQELMEQLAEATHALVLAKQALGKAAPNARDYPIGRWTYDEAREQHAARIGCIEVLIKHLGIVALGIAQQGKEIVTLGKEGRDAFDA